MKCRRCNRPLKTRDSIQKGIGPICEKQTGYIEHKTKGDDAGDRFIDYDGGDIFIERIPAVCIFESSGMGLVHIPHEDESTGCRTNVPRQIYKHSPTGYNFGYAGSGPADFALNICLLFCKHADDAYKVYQEFKFKFVAVDCGKRLDIPRCSIENFLTEKGIQLK